MPKTVRFRVELKTGKHPEILGYLVACRAHHSALVPYASWLAQEGRTGILSLIDEASGAVVARRRVVQSQPGAWTPTRKRGVAPALYEEGAGEAQPTSIRLGFADN